MTNWFTDFIELDQALLEEDDFEDHTLVIMWSKEGGGDRTGVRHLRYQNDMLAVWERYGLLYLLSQRTQRERRPFTENKSLWIS